jgi:hypothetical protein
MFRIICFGWTSHYFILDLRWLSWYNYWQQAGQPRNMFLLLSKGKRFVSSPQHPYHTVTSLSYQFTFYNYQKRRKSKRGPPETFTKLVSPSWVRAGRVTMERQSVDGTSRGGKCWPKEKEKRERSDERKGWEYDAGRRRVGGNGCSGHRKGSNDDRRGYVDHRNRRGVVALSWRCWESIVHSRWSARSAKVSSDDSGRQMRLAWMAGGRRLVQMERRRESGTSRTRRRR